MFPVTDLERIGKNVELDISVTQSDLFSLLDVAMGRGQQRNKQKENNKVNIVKEFQVKLKNRTQWERQVYGKCSHSTNSCQDLRAMVNKHKQKRRKISRPLETATRS